ncbi:MAG: hypothetical protein P4L50_26775 [Anaerolineaceae bacterium]|nr:hypothetical protein [Anaerolineaceae bacterium]
MKQAISISIGSGVRDKAVELSLLGEKVRLERIGTDGDMSAAARLYQEMDGKVDAFGVGGADLGLMVDNHWYPLYSVQPLVRSVKVTPVVDGTGLKVSLEKQVADVIEIQLSGKIQNRKVLVVAGTDRWGMSSSFLQAGYECVFGDFMFSLGLPVALHSARQLKLLAKLLLPIIGRIPFEWIYPIGEKQEHRTPKWESYFQWASVIAGDCHYIRRFMPDRLDGKVIVTNTTTPADLELFRSAGVRYLITTTPVLDGRSFGTNVMEAGLVAAMGWNKPVNYAHPGEYLREIDRLVGQLQFKPQVQELSL